MKAWPPKPGSTVIDHHDVEEVAIRLELPSGSPAAGRGRRPAGFLDPAQDWLERLLDLDVDGHGVAAAARK